MVGPGESKEKIQAYKPGRAKLLAMTKNDGPELASKNSTLAFIVLFRHFRLTYYY